MHSNLDNLAQRNGEYDLRHKIMYNCMDHSPIMFAHHFVGISPQSPLAVGAAVMKVVLTLRLIQGSK